MAQPPRRRPDDEWLLQLADGTRSASQIGAIMGKTRAQIIGRVHRWPHGEPRPHLTVPGQTSAKPRTWSARDDALLAKLAWERASMNIMCKTFHCVAGVVHDRMAQLRAADPGWPKSALPQPAPRPAAVLVAAGPTFPTQCTTPGCRNTRQPGRDHCSTCISSTYTAHRKKVAARGGAPLAFEDDKV